MYRKTKILRACITKYCHTKVRKTIFSRSHWYKKIQQILEKRGILRGYFKIGYPLYLLYRANVWHKCLHLKQMVTKYKIGYGPIVYGLLIWCKFPSTNCQMQVKTNQTFSVFSSPFQFPFLYYCNSIWKYLFMT